MPIGSNAHGIARAAASRANRARGGGGSSASIIDWVQGLDARLKAVEDRFYEMGFDMKQVAQTEVKKRWKVQAQSETFFGVYTALCIDTLDIWKQGRVRFYSPLLNKPDTQVKQLEWAYPISSMGGFDDNGLNWVPPAGSTLLISFERGSRSTPYYHGTTWHRDRGPTGEHTWDYPIEEYYKIHEGHRKGYLVGPNDESQVFPPWNTESYNGFDLTSIKDLDDDSEASKKICYPHIYGFKTVEKHMLKMVDGNPKCNRRWKRLEIQSGCGNHLIFKDDHMHPTPQWANPSSGGGGGTGVELCPCTDASGQQPVEQTSCDAGCKVKKANPYFKHANEMRPYNGPGTPQNNKCELPQTGIQFLSISGHTLWMDDSVEQPQGIPNWERSLQPFDFGCTNRFLGKTAWVSTTGHRIEMNDWEEPSKIRGYQDKKVGNWIQLLSACGNKIELNDHTTAGKLAGEHRGIHMQSTSNHTIDLCDWDNEQQSERKDGGVPTPQAKKAYVKIRSGYGMEIMMDDNATQKQETQQQSLQIFCPQYTNPCGPHLMRFQERATPDNALVFLRVGGNYICSTCRHHYTVVGDEDKGLVANKITVVTKDYMEVTKGIYFNKARTHMFLADEMIYLLAGKDCPSMNSGDSGPCAFPILVYTPWGITISDRVIASASQKSQTAPVWALQPFIHNPNT